MGRPTKLCDRTKGLILVGIRLGLTYEDAAQAAGVHRSTFHRWMQKGKSAKSGVYRDFCDALERANAEGQIINAKIVHDAAKGGQPIKETRTVTRANGTQETTVTERVAQPDWRCSAWILERRFTESWGRRDSLKTNLELSGVVTTQKSVAELDAEIAKALAKFAPTKDKADDSSETEGE